MISTRLTRMLDIRQPIVQAGMGGVARAELVAAVSNAGGLGMLGMIRMPPDFIREQIRQTRRLTQQPFGVNLVPSVMTASSFEAQLEVCLEESIPVVSLFWCDAAPFVERCRAAGVLLMLQVGSLEEGRCGAAAGVDVIVAQGVEAGGHVRGETGLFPLLASVVDAVSPVPVIAAGGIADGRGLAAALALGAEGVWVGTRFVASMESEAHPDYKKRLLGAAAADTIYTQTFHVGWPPQSPHRVLKNSITNGDPPPPGPVAHTRFAGQTVEVPPYGSAAPTVHTEGRTELMANYAGQGVGLIREILPAAEIVNRMVSEAEAIMQGLAVRLCLLLLLAAVVLSAQQRNPYATPADAAAGARIFRSHCADCHGLKGEGGKGPNLSSGVYYHGSSDGSLFRNITDGIPGTAMPSQFFSADQIWQVVAHLRALARTGSYSAPKGDPQRGGAVFRSKGCFGCHIARGEGGINGPDLSFIGSQRPIEFLRQSIMEPNAHVAREFWLAEVILENGAASSGFVVNEDTYYVQMLTQDRGLVTLPRKDFRKLEIRKNSIMPSYEGKLTEAELTDLISYLWTLQRPKATE